LRILKLSWLIVNDALWRFLAHDGWAIASHIALSTLMAMFPFLIVVTALAGFFFGSKELADEAARILLEAWPKEVAGPLAFDVTDVLTNTRGDVLTFGLLFALYFASSGVDGLRIGLNRAYDAVEARSWWILRLEAIVYVLIGAVAILLTEIRLANVSAQDAARIDLPGLATFSCGLFLLIFGLIRGNPEGWESGLIVASLGGAVALLLAFIAIESRSSHPMLELGLFRKPAFNGVSAVAFGLSAGMFAMFLYLTIYMQGVLDYSPLETGLRFLPLTVLSFIASPIAGSLSHRIPIRALLGVGLGLVGLGLLLMHGISADSSVSELLPGFLLAGIGIGTANPGIGQAAIAVVPVEKAGMGSGINTTFRQVGIATGVASLGAVFQSRVDSKLSELLPNGQHGLAEIVSSGGSRAAAAVTAPAQRPEVTHAAKVAFVSGFNEILLIGSLISFTVALMGFLLVRPRDFVQQVEAEPATAAA
jgi:hypothetical protein